MFEFFQNVIKNAAEDSTFREELTPLWMLGSVVVGVVAAVTITSAISKGYASEQDLLE